MYYVSPGDEFAEKLVKMREEEGIDDILEKVCEQDPNGTLGMLVKEKIALLKFGWLDLLFARLE